jgi:CheY-like chemotaxis protein
MKILIAEDDSDVALTYKIGLDLKNYNVTITSNGEDCLKIYNEELHKIRFDSNKDNYNYSGSLENNPPFDIVILDYLMPKINGLEVAKEILTINLHQRIIFASAFVKDTLKESIGSLKHDVEVIEKPFSLVELVKTLEDEKLYRQLKDLDVDIELIRAVSPKHAQIKELLERIRKT